MPERTRNGGERKDKAYSHYIPKEAVSLEGTNRDTKTTREAQRNGGAIQMGHQRKSEATKRMRYEKAVK